MRPLTRCASRCTRFARFAVNGRSRGRSSSSDAPGSRAAIRAISKRPIRWAAPPRSSRSTSCPTITSRVRAESAGAVGGRHHARRCDAIHPDRLAAVIVGDRDKFGACSKTSDSEASARSFLREGRPISSARRRRRPAYEDAPDPLPQPGRAIVRVRACALNHLDLWQRRGIARVRIPVSPHLGRRCRRRGRRRRQR